MQVCSARGLEGLSPLVNAKNYEISTFCARAPLGIPIALHPWSNAKYMLSDFCSSQVNYQNEVSAFYDERLLFSFTEIDKDLLPLFP